MSFVEWFKAHLPTRESLAANPWTRPVAGFALRPELWRVNRRSVPPAVALGLFVGNALPFPGLHTILVVLLAFPFRANIPIAIATSFAMLPAIPFVIAGGIWLGGIILPTSDDSTSFREMVEGHASWSQWMDWLLSEQAPAILLGLFIIGIVSAILGYLVTSLFWRWWIGRKWRSRSKRLAAKRKE